MSLPFLKLFVAEYLSDTMHLDDAEHGRYLLLLMALWRAPRQRLPNDDRWLARRFNRSVERVETELRPIISEFCQCDGNWISNKRIDAEYEEASRTSSAQSVRAKSRWRKEKSDAHAVQAGTAEQQQPALPGIADARDTAPSESRKPLIGNETFHASQNQSQSQSHSKTRKEKASLRSAQKKARLAARRPPDHPALNGANHGTRLPEGWRPTPDLVRYAKDHALDPQSEAAAFADYWQAESGQRASKRDWSAAFRTWCRRSASPGGGGRPAPVRAAKPGGGLDAFARGVARVVGRQRQR